MYESGATVVVPSIVCVTVTSTVLAERGGVRQVMRVGETTVTSVQALRPKVTVSPSAKFVPCPTMLTKVPPATEPRSGST